MRRRKSRSPSLRIADVYTARGLLRINLLHDWSGARTDLERALSLSPSSVDSLLQYGWLLGRLGRLPEAVASMRRGTILDPLAVGGWIQLSYLYFGTGQLDLAEAAATRALDLSPEQGRAARNLGFVFLLAGRLADARATFQRSSFDDFRLMGESMVEHALHHPVESQRALDKLLAERYVSSAGFQVAQVYAWRGETDRAFEWLERAYEHRDAGLGYLKYDPFLRNLRSDPRYTALLKKMNLPLD